jgi:hypothetical protein
VAGAVDAPGAIAATAADRAVARAAALQVQGFALAFIHHAFASKQVQSIRGAA